MTLVGLGCTDPLAGFCHLSTSFAAFGGASWKLAKLAAATRVLVRGRTYAHARGGPGKA
jgi:hypothetical protein